MAQAPPFEEDLLPNLSHPFQQTLNIETTVPSQRQTPLSVPSRRKPVPIRSQKDTIPYARSLNPFQSTSQHKTQLGHVQRFTNPIISDGRAHARSSNNTTESAPVFIGVVGVTGSGKSSLIKRVTGCDDVVVSDGLMPGNHFRKSPNIQR